MAVSVFVVKVHGEGFKLQAQHAEFCRASLRGARLRTQGKGGEKDALELLIVEARRARQYCIGHYNRLSIARSWVAIPGGCRLDGRCES